jgi:hypothetical protein
MIYDWNWIYEWIYDDLRLNQKRFNTILKMYTKATDQFVYLVTSNLVDLVVTLCALFSFAWSPDFGG